MLTSSGQAASFYSVFNICRNGDHLISTSAIYGGTFNLFAVTMKKMGVEFTFVSPDCTEEELEAASTMLIRVSDDGSWGEKGLVTDALRKLAESGEVYDEVLTFGPLPMMKFVCKLTRELGIKTVASMNPIMIDGTGMCGGCRLRVGGKTVFACMDGPEFDGHLIDFDEAIARSSMYREFERHAYEETCNLFAKEAD